MGLGSKTTEVKASFLSYSFKGMGWTIHYFTVNMNLNHLTEVVFVRFFHCKLFFYSPFLYKTLWKGVLVHNWNIIRKQTTLSFSELCGVEFEIFLSPMIGIFPPLFLSSIITTSMWTRDIIFTILWVITNIVLMLS